MIFLNQEAQSPKQTEDIAGYLAKELRRGDVVAFYGELGSGKTFFIKTVCRFFNVLEEATSPSFTIINEYHSRENLYIYHFDFYRLDHDAELQNLGLDEFFFNDYICLIEWADKIDSYLPGKRWEVYLKFIDEKPRARRIIIEKVNLR